ncbi:MAG: hypothetical protein RL375_784 [Pseudomonadota bacterium]|jgi:hypothetical protein
MRGQRKGKYVPQPGTIPARVISYLEEQLAKGRQWVPGAELCEMLEQPAVTPYLEAPLKHGCIKRRTVSTNRRLTEYALGDGKPLPVAEDAERDEPLHPVPPMPGAAPLFPTVVPSKRGAKPANDFHAGLFTDGTLSIKLGDTSLDLDAQQTSTLARLLRSWSEAAAC